MFNLNGRIIIYANYTEEQFTKMFNYGQELPKVNPFT